MSRVSSRNFAAKTSCIKHCSVLTGFSLAALVLCVFRLPIALLVRSLAGGGLSKQVRMLMLVLRTYLLG